MSLHAGVLMSFEGEEEDAGGHSNRFGLDLVSYCGLGDDRVNASNHSSNPKQKNQSYKGRDLYI